MQPLIPEQYLRGGKKLLFISSFALGDYVYMRTYFHALLTAYPDLTIDFFRDEPHRTWRWWRWEGMKRYILYDWLESDGAFRRIYKETYAPAGFKHAVTRAQQEQYDVVVSLCKSSFYARLARKIGQESAFVVGLTRTHNTINSGQKLKRWWYGKLLDQELCVDTTHTTHINNLFASWFERLFGLTLSSIERRPRLTIPAQWQEKIHHDGTDTIVLFINPYAATWRRTWPLAYVRDLIIQLTTYYPSQTFRWIINAPRDQYEGTQAFFLAAGISQVQIFSAQRHFFQLAAAIQQCDAVISVDTSTVHFAGALDKPTIALIRHKNLAWQPWNKVKSCAVTTQAYAVSYITVDHVMTFACQMIDRVRADKNQSSELRAHQG